ncbi:MAG: hypothetical protein WD266_05290 [Balneolales bacterium]
MSSHRKRYLDRQYAGKNTLSDLLFSDGKALHTPREIAQQPWTWRQTGALMSRHAPELQAFLQKAGLYNKGNRPSLILTGAGTSDYVGLSLVDLLRNRFATHCHNWSTTRITVSPDVYFTANHNHVLIHFARSGNSPESTAVLDMALRHFPNVTHHLVITCNKDGELARIADEHPDKVYSIVLDESTNDKGLAMTSSFSNLVLAGQALVHLSDMDHFQDLVERMAGAAEYFINTYCDQIYDLASPELTRAFYLGNNELLGAAVESALKVQELTRGRLMAKGEDTMAFRHGPVSAVDSHTLVCFFLSADAFTLQYELDVLYQFSRPFQEMGTKTVVVSAGSQKNDRENEDYIHHITFDPEAGFNIPKLYQVNIQILFGQLFGLFSAHRRGIHIDDPTSGDHPLYSRTVKGVRLYDYLLNDKSQI